MGNNWCTHTFIVHTSLNLYSCISLVKNALSGTIQTLVYDKSLRCGKLGYCNSVLFNVTEKEISKLQGVHNCLARVVTKFSRFCLITLHWGHVCCRIKFKVCFLTYQDLTSGQSVYIQNLLQPSRKLRTLCSSNLDQLNVSRVRSAVDSRAFFVAAPRLWNKLPLETLRKQ